MRFRGYTELTEEERNYAKRMAEEHDVPVSEILRRMAGYARCDL